MLQWCPKSHLNPFRTWASCTRDLSSCLLINPHSKLGVLVRILGGTASISAQAFWTYWGFSVVGNICPMKNICGLSWVQCNTFFLERFFVLQRNSSRIIGWSISSLRHIPSISCYQVNHKGKVQCEYYQKQLWLRGTVRSSCYLITEGIGSYFSRMQELLLVSRNCTWMNMGARGWYFVLWSGFLIHFLQMFSKPE